MATWQAMDRCHRNRAAEAGAGALRLATSHSVEGPPAQARPQQLALERLVIKKGGLPAPGGERLLQGHVWVFCSGQRPAEKALLAWLVSSSCMS